MAAIRSIEPGRNIRCLVLVNNQGMDRKQLELTLVAEGFPPDSYVMHGSDRNDTLNIEQQGSKFVVYYTERGSRSDDHEFLSEADACDYFLESESTVLGVQTS